MGFLRFFSRHAIPGPVAVVGGAVVIVGYILEARDVVALGLPIAYWQAIGAALFMGSMIAILYRWDQNHVAPSTQVVRDGTKPVLLPAQEQALILLDKYSRQFAASKLVIARRKGTLHFDNSPQRGKDINLITELFGSDNPETRAKFETLI